MATTDRLISITSASFAGSTVEGVVEAAWSVRAMKKRGRSDGEVGHTTMNKTWWDVTGTLTIDSDAAVAILCTGAVGILILVGKRTGASATMTITLGRTASGATSGVAFIGSGDLTISSDGPGGDTPRFVFPFKGVFHPLDTQLENSATNGLITIAVA